jgi:hypothetical protein
MVLESLALLGVAVAPLAVTLGIIIFAVRSR